MQITAWASRCKRLSSARVLRSQRKLKSAFKLFTPPQHHEPLPLFTAPSGAFLRRERGSGSRGDATSLPKCHFVSNGAVKTPPPTSGAKEKVRGEEFVPGDATPSFALSDCEEWWRGHWGGGGGGGGEAEAWHIGWLIRNLSARRRRGNTQGRRWEGRGRAKITITSLSTCVCVCDFFFSNQWNPKRIKGPTRKPSNSDGS